MHFSVERLLSMLGVTTSGLIIDGGQISESTPLVSDKLVVHFHGHPAPTSTVTGRRGTVHVEICL